MTVPKVLLVDDNAELVELLAQVFAGAGYRTTTCLRGKAAIASIEDDPPDVAVIDLLLPDVMGYEVGKVLQARGIPFVFCTGVFKGGKHAIDATRSRGAQAYFEKPFESSKLLETIRALVPPPPLSEHPTAGPAFEVELDIDIEEPDLATPAKPLELTGRIAVSGESINAVLMGKDFAVAAPRANNTYVRPAKRPPPPPVELQRPEEPPEPQPEEVSRDGKVRRGELRDNLPQLLTAFWQLQETGELGLQRGKVKKVIYFEKGQPVFALSNLASDRYGNFLVRIGRIDETQLKAAAAVAAQGSKRTGDVLIEMGLLKDAERMYYVAQQVKAIIYSIFGWEEGSYVMSFLDKAKAEPIRLGVPTAQLIARGVRKLYKVERLERLIALEDRPIPSPDPAFQLSEVEIEPWEAQLLSKITGDRTVAELLAMAGRPAAEVYATLGALFALKILEKREDVILE